MYVYMNMQVILSLKLLQYRILKFIVVNTVVILYRIMVVSAALYMKLYTTKFKRNKSLTIL